MFKQYRSKAGSGSVRWLAALLAFCSVGSAWACADFYLPPVYSLTQPSANVPFLAPTNNRSVTLMLLLSDAGLAQPRLPDKPRGKVGAYFGETPLLRDTVAAVFGENEVPGTADDEACPSRNTVVASREFLKAMRASTLPKHERALLTDARRMIDSHCDSTTGSGIKSVLAQISSPVGKEFADYLEAADAFYSDDFVISRYGFAFLMTSKHAWLKEAATYMVPRSDLKQAQQKAIGEYGELNLENVDAKTLASAEEGLRAYLKKYPRGKYAASAHGLLRRVAWFSRDNAKLEKEFKQAFAITDPSKRNVSVPVLAYEAVNKLLENAKPEDIHEPRLLATIDLAYMRREQPWSEPGKPVPPPEPARLTRTALKAQKADFANQKELFNYLLAAYAFYAENNPAEALKLLGSAATPESKMGFVSFSQQILKGLALEASKEPMMARAHWLALIPLAEPVLQRPAVELALAQNYEKSGELDAVFAPDSLIQSQTYREVLLAYSAGPTLLRQQAMALDATTRERQLALYVLLFKELTREHYQDFLDDLRLIPASEPLTKKSEPDTYYYEYTLPSHKFGTRDESPLLTDFNWPGTKAGKGFACPSLRDTADALASNPQDARSQICLGEFLRLNDYDGFLTGARRFPEWRVPTELGTVAVQFPGKGRSRLDIYKEIIANPKAARDARAYALYRAVNCWAPSSHNACDNTNDPVSQRKQWFQELKTKYRGTVWADTLKYYW